MAADPNLPAQVTGEYATFSAQTTAEQQILEDIADANFAEGVSGDPLKGLAGFKFPTNISQHDLDMARQAAETFANNVGWRGFPSIGMIINVAQSGLVGGDQTWALKAFYNAMRPEEQARVPWARFGLTRQAYESRNQQLDSVAEDLTGPNTATFDQAFQSEHLRELVHANNWSDQQLKDFVMRDPKYQQQYGWFRHQMTYNQMTDYVDKNAESLQTRFGRGNNSIATGLQNLDNPLHALNVGGTSIGNASVAANAKSPLGDYSSSEVR